MKRIIPNLKNAFASLNLNINSNRLEKGFIFLLPIVVIGFLLFFPTKDYSNKRTGFESRLAVEANYLTETQKDIPKLDKKVLTEGTGDREAKAGDIISVNYRGWLAINGTIFDQSSGEGKSAFSVTLGQNGVIKGWEQAIPGMKLHEVRRLYIPSDLAYADKGSGETIPPNSDLIFDVEIVRFEN